MMYMYTIVCMYIYIYTYIYMHTYVRLICWNAHARDFPLPYEIVKEV